MFFSAKHRESANNCWAGGTEGQGGAVRGEDHHTASQESPGGAWVWATVEGKQALGFTALWRRLIT